MRQMWIVLKGLPHEGHRPEKRVSQDQRWKGSAFLKWAIDELVPELKLSLGIPEDHLCGYVMVFGKPTIEYKRTIAKGPANVVTFDVSA